MAPDDDLSALVDQLLEEDPELRRLFSKLHRQQARLKRALTPSHFRLYLRLEDCASELLYVLVDRLWTAARSAAFAEGDPPQRQA